MGDRSTEKQVKKRGSGSDGGGAYHIMLPVVQMVAHPSAAQVPLSNAITN
jgi:hypothetical protein